MPVSRNERLFAFSAVAVGTMMVVLNGTIANVALPTIGRAFGIDAAATIWATNGFQVPVMMFLLAGAAYGQMCGFARLYRWGMLFYLAGSLVCSFAPSFPLLVAGRAVQGIGAAGVMSVGPALIRQIFPREQLGQALGWNALIVGLSAAGGPTIGGAILAGFDWHALFLFSIPFGVYSYVAGRLALRDAPVAHCMLDLPSVFASAAGLGLFVVALDGLAHGVAAPLVAGGAAVAVVLFVLFLRRQPRIDDPLLPLDAFANPTFTLSTLTSLASFFAAAMAIVALPFLFQGVMGLSPLDSGLLFAPWPIATSLVAPLSGRLSDRVSPASISTIGLGVLAVGLAFLAQLPADAGIAQIVWREAVAGIGFGLFQSPNNRQIMTALPREQSGVSSGMLAMARLTGQTFGAALVAIVFGAYAAQLTAPGGAAIGEQHALATTLWIATGLAGVAFVVSALRLRTREPGWRTQS